LVIGGTGFIGGYLVDNLAKKTGLELNLIYAGELLEENKLPGITYHQMDLTNISDELSDLVNGSDCVISLATPNISLIENLIGSVKPGGPKKIVYSSTMLVYPDSDQLSSENIEPAPETEYEKNKVAEERLLMEFVGTHEVKVCLARLGNVYGDIKNRGLVNYVMSALINDSTLTINGQGQHKRDYIFVQDVADLLDFLIFNDQKSDLEIFNVCTSHGYTINQVINEIEKLSGRQIKKFYGELIKEKLNVVGDNSKIISLSGYQLKYDLVSGLQQTYHNYLAKG